MMGGGQRGARGDRSRGTCTLYELSRAGKKGGERVVEFSCARTRGRDIAKPAKGEKGAVGREGWNERNMHGG